MAEKTFITALTWVPRGVAKVVTDTYEPTEEELNSYKNLSKKLKKAKEGEYFTAAEELESNLKNLNLDNYENETSMPVFCEELQPDEAAMEAEEEHSGNTEEVSEFSDDEEEKEGAAGGAL